MYRREYTFSCSDIVRSVIGATMKNLPSYIIIGSPKCGTTSLYYSLLAHVGITGPTKKEINFFDISLYKGLNWYKSFFCGNPQKKYMEASMSYCIYPMIPQIIKNFLPNVKIIMCVRTPVERLISHYKHYLHVYNQERHVIPFRTIIDSLEVDSKAFTFNPILQRWINIAEYGLYDKIYQSWKPIFKENFFIFDFDKQKEKKYLTQKHFQFSTFEKHKTQIFKN